MNSAETSLDLIYALAVNSYDLLVRRIDELNQLLVRLTLLIIPAGLVFPILANKLDVYVTTEWQLVLVIAIILSFVMCMSFRMQGTIKLIDPNKFRKESFSIPPDDFKKQMIAFAGNAFRENNSMIEKKWKNCRYAAGFIIFLLVLGFFFLMVSLQI